MFQIINGSEEQQFEIPICIAQNAEDRTELWFPDPRWKIKAWQVAAAEMGRNKQMFNPLRARITKASNERWGK